MSTKSRNKPASDKIFERYVESIGTEVIAEFGGSYQNYETMGRTWRQQYPYSDKIADFLVLRSKVFFNFVSEPYKSDLNVMYKVCDKVADYLSEYTVKKSSDMTVTVAKEELFAKLFFENRSFIYRFNKLAERNINRENKRYISGNPGFFAMQRALQEKQR